MHMNNSIVMLTTDSQIDRRILHEADSLESDGWKVTIIAMPANGDSHGDDKRVVRLPTYEKLQKDVFLFHIYRWVSQRIPIHTHVKQWIRKVAWYISSDRETFYINLFKDTLEKYSPAVFLAHDLPMLPVACYAALRCGAKVAYDSHELYTELEFSTHEKSQWRLIEDKYIRQCNLVITVNPFIADELKSRYNLPSEVQVIYNAVVSDLSIKRQRLFHKLYDLKAEDKVLLLQGGLSANRNLEVLVKSMALVKNPTLNLVVLGDGPLKKRLKSIAKSLNLTSRVHFHDAVPQSALLQYTASADVGIIPYQAICLNNYYCTPNKLFEFISVGIPILASNLPAIESIITSHKIGEVCDMSSASKLATAIDHFFSNTIEIDMYNENAAKAKIKLKWEAEKIIQLFERFKCA